MCYVRLGYSGLPGCAAAAASSVRLHYHSFQFRLRRSTATHQEDPCAASSLSPARFSAPLRPPFVASKSLRSCPTTVLRLAILFLLLRRRCITVAVQIPPARPASSLPACSRPRSCRSARRAAARGHRPFRKRRTRQREQSRRCADFGNGGADRPPRSLSPSAVLMANAK